MRIGVVKEIKPAERRVALTPAGARELVTLGHDVLVEANAGAGSGCPDDAYISIGARILGGAEEVWRDSELLLKVKEPVEGRIPAAARPTSPCSPTCTWHPTGRSPRRC